MPFRVVETDALFVEKPARPLYSGVKTGVSSGTTVTVVTIPANGVTDVVHISCTGEESARWELYLDSVLIDMKRTTNRNVTFEFGTALEILEGEVFDVKVFYNGPESSADFNATIYGYSV